jgi:hypothetical protein
LTSDRSSIRWLGALAVVACALAVTPIAGQVSPIRLDTEAAEERYKAFPQRLDSSAIGPTIGSLAVGRSNRQPRLSRGKIYSDPGFLRGHLLPRMSRQIGDVSSIHALETHRETFQDSGIQAWVSNTVEHRALRASQKAAKAYLLEATTIGSWLESSRIGGGIERVAKSSTDFRFDVSRGIPKVGLRHRAAMGTTRFQVSLDGSVRLEFRPNHTSTARFYAGYEAAVSGYRLSYRLGF